MAKSFFERLTGSVRVNDAAVAEPLRDKKASVAGTAPSARPKEKRASSPLVMAEEPDAKPKVMPPMSSEESGYLPAMAEEPSDEGELTVDIFDDGPNMVIQSTVAGVKPDDIDISLQEDTLTIRGSRKRAQEVSDENFYYRELYWGTFSRSIILPEEVDFAKAQAVIKNGLLTIKLPKKDKGEKKIQVKVGD